MTTPERATAPDAALKPIARQRHRKRRSLIPRRLRRLFRVLPWQLIVIVLILALVVPSAAVAVFAADSYARVREALASLERVLVTLNGRSFAELTESDFERLQASVSNLNGALRRAQQQTGLLRLVASAIDEVEILLTGLDAAQNMSGAAQNMLEGVRPALVLLARSQKPEALMAQERLEERLIELLRAAQGRFETARTQLQAAQSHIQNIGLARLPANLLSDYRQLVRYYALLDDFNRVLIGLPVLITELSLSSRPRTTCCSHRITMSCVLRAATSAHMLAAPAPIPHHRLRLQRHQSLQPQSAARRLSRNARYPILVVQVTYADHGGVERQLVCGLPQHSAHGDLVL